MSNPIETVVDIEGDDLYHGVTKIHVLSYQDVNMTEPKSLYTQEEIQKFFQEDRIFVGHFWLGYDAPTLKKVYGIDYDPSERIVDTLPLSWYLNFKRDKHGLESYGKDAGVPKPPIKDWKNLTIEDYTFRCESDVKINFWLWRSLRAKLLQLYGNYKGKIPNAKVFKEELPVNAQRLIKYMNFKTDCLFEQSKYRWRIDVPHTTKLRDTLSKLEQEKLVELTAAMPQKPIMKTHNKPKLMHKKDGTLSALGIKWLEKLSEYNQPNTCESFDTIDSYEDGNPKSHSQVKDWLYSLGWEPCTWKFTKDKATGKDKQIPQVRKDGELTPSVLLLVEKYPELQALEGLTVVSHRLGIAKAFLSSMDNEGYVEAGATGFTNTLRLKHSKPCVNLPSVDKPYGKEVRGCLIAPEGYELCGSDMVSLEDTTKRHYMKPFDPEYVAEMSQEGYDPHLSLAVFSGKISQEDYDWYAWFESQDEDYRPNNLEELKARASDIKSIRKAYKVVNYSAVYGIQAKGLSRSSGLPVKQCQELLDAYWRKNYAVQKAVKNLKTKEMGDGSKWLFNPVSRFWYNLRSEKDKFSTLNQGTGVFCFDMELVFIRAQGIIVIGQFHDEHIDLVPLGEGEREKHKEKLLKANDQANETIKLLVDLGVDVQFGDRYSDIH